MPKLLLKIFYDCLIRHFKKLKSHVFFLKYEKRNLYVFSNNGVEKTSSSEHETDWLRRSSWTSTNSWWRQVPVVSMATGVKMYVSDSTSICLSSCHGCTTGCGSCFHGCVAGVWVGIPVRDCDVPCQWLPLDHDRIVVPSGRLPSCRSRPTGSLTDGICALFVARQMMSLRCERRCCLGALSRQVSPWSPRASTTYYYDDGSVVHFVDCQDHDVPCTVCSFGSTSKHWTRSVPEPTFQPPGRRRALKRPPRSVGGDPGLHGQLDVSSLCQPSATCVCVCVCVWFLLITASDGRTPQSRANDTRQPGSAKLTWNLGGRRLQFWHRNVLPRPALHFGVSAPRPGVDAFARRQAAYFASEYN